MQRSRASSFGNSPSRTDGGLVQTGPTNLDLYAKDALQELLKPCNYAAIQPWLWEARTQEKRDVVKLAELARQGGNCANCPPAWLPPPQEPVIKNEHGRVRMVKTVPVTADRVQSDLQKARSGSEQRSTALAKKRNWCRDWAPIPNINTVGDFYHLRDHGLYQNECAQVLSESAKRALYRWQIEGPEKHMGISANVMRSMRSLADAVARIPRYTQVQNRQSSGYGRRDLLYEYGQEVPASNVIQPRTLMPAPYAIPDRTLVHSSSAPATLRPIIDPADIARIKQPGGQVVDLMDREPLAMLKNRQRNNTSSVGGGGSTEYALSSHKVGLHSALSVQAVRAS
eukprot:TRINITY_DN26505_c0_g1_i1.p1 TRINITY_DN26505_c0_g1~~TRINITY_DN26505_c0_g1_i1.p1  ORF type:complete len:341 (+),score=64.44 TRINITY_DN26505_c0_g1_i1:110-1132(+)